MKQNNSNPEKSPNANSRSRTVSIDDQIRKIKDSVPTTAKTPPPPMPKKSK